MQGKAACIQWAEFFLTKHSITPSKDRPRNLVRQISPSTGKKKIHNFHILQ